jgi:hypothetical protein
MLRLAFDFIITWRETRTRPNAYKEGHVRVMGMLQCISRQRMNMQEQTVDRLNSLLSRLNGISKSLLDFLHSDDITLVINKI